MFRIDKFVTMSEASEQLVFNWYFLRILVLTVIVKNMLN